MSTKDLWDRFVKAVEADQGGFRAPPLEMTAIVVQMERRLQNWKVSTLADFAGVSVSTVERVERGEPVSRESLDQIAVALGHEVGHYTEPRWPRPMEDVHAEMAEQFGNMEVVKVKVLKTQADVRQIANCHACLPVTPQLPAEFQDEVLGLVEWFDLAGFLMCGALNGGHGGEGRRRELYSDILEAVADLERKGLTVLCGVMDAPRPDFEDHRVAVLSVSQKATDPGAPKRKIMLIDRRLAYGPGRSLWDIEESVGSQTGDEKSTTNPCA
ncbi:helix-turn-helix domain-containing protein [Asticcacaulis taihuensis]|uniref:HTH cro/C1-type domain-containing protein n=1 Tax=Asticcacaulis taihuensis TaxID=260084 RepID=A0A1G4S991_9CAUL|nr:helix-turn-helix transcriptional regulator [Asticcacaulis taihuensis]SCW65764.1 hypothetical protein SAMN02927928_2461 [Asticcacaulis taihuensis]